MPVGPESLIGPFAAAGRAKVAQAQAAQRLNVTTCLLFLDAAVTAIRGLEAEWDGILAQAKALDPTDRIERGRLFQRVYQFERGDELRPVLHDAIGGLEKSVDALRRDARSFLRPVGRERRKLAVAELEQLLRELDAYLHRLGALAATPSGVQLRDLSELRWRLEQAHRGLGDGEAAMADFDAFVEQIEDRRDKSDLFELGRKISALTADLTAAFA